MLGPSLQVPHVACNLPPLLHIRRHIPRAISGLFEHIQLADLLTRSMIAPDLPKASSCKAISALKGLRNGSRPLPECGSESQ